MLPHNILINPNLAQFGTLNYNSLAREKLPHMPYKRRPKTTS